MADIKIKVGASIDSSLENVFQPLRDGARRARAQMNSDARQSDKAAQADMLAVARNRYKEESKLNRDMFKARAAQAQQSEKAIFDMAIEKRRARTAIELAEIRKVADAERNAAKLASQERIAAMKTAAQEIKRQERNPFNAGGLMGYIGGRRIVREVGRDIGRVARGVGRFGMDFASGLGIDLSVAGGVRRNVEREQLAATIVESGYIPGSRGAAGTRQDPNALLQEARTVANANRLDPTKVLEGVQKFVGITGDLKTARETMSQLGAISRATGSNMEDVAEAAGNISAQIAEGPGKASEVLHVMRAVAGQGKLGAAEISVMAKQMAALAAQAGSFRGDKGDTIALMGVIAQEARQHGGAKSAPEAAFAVSSFVSALSKKARLAALQAHGVKVYDADNKILSPQQIITNAIAASKGDPRVLFGQMFSDARAQKAVRGFSNIYNETQGTPAQKIAAVTAEFDRLKSAMMTEENVREAAARKMDTDQAKAQAFQNRLDEVTQSLQARLLPALEAAAPSIIKIAEGAAKLVEWAAGNPWQAASTALALSVAKAGIGEVIGRALGMSIAGQGAGMLGTAGAAGAVGLGSLLITAGTAAIAIAALGAAAEQAQKLWNETHEKTTSSMTPEEMKRYSALTPEQKDAEIAAAGNVKSLEAQGHVTGRAEKFGPPTAEVEMLTDPAKLAQVNELQLRTLGDILGVMRSQLASLDEIKEKSGNNPNGAAGFLPPPEPSTNGVTNSTQMMSVQPGGA